jgi:hypothetical protein
MLQGMSCQDPQEITNMTYKNNFLGHILTNLSNSGYYVLA